MSLTLSQSAAGPRRSQRRAGAKAIIDRAQLDASLADLAQRHAGNAADLRTAAVEAFTTALRDGQARARTWLEADGRGLDCARALSHLEDELLRAIHFYVTRFVYPEGDADTLCIVAVGGYGRGTLAPGSDIDLLFLVPDQKSGAGEQTVEAILYVLWDMKQKVGHATRSVTECIARARDDMTIRTTLLEARLVLGPPDAYDGLLKRFRKEVVRGSECEFTAAKLAERDLRLRRAGNSRYLVEPNVKESKGGLRDLNTLFWIARYTCDVREPEGLVVAGVFTPRELELFRRCEEFLWRVRCHLHFLTGRPEDRLSFDQQRPIAARLGYVTKAGLSDVERFMKHYFLVAKDVGDLTAIVCAALEERHAKPPAMLDRFAGLLRRKKSVESDGFAVEVGRITVAGADVFERDPVNLIRLFWLANRDQLPIHPDAKRLVTRNLTRVDVKLRANPDANRLFLEILTSLRGSETVLRQMNETGVLGRFIPDFGRIVAMMQFNMYHHYTVDEHLLRSIGILSDLESGRLVEEHPLCHEVLPSIANRTLLYVALFLHDIAKGRQEDHSLAGAQVARQLCPRLGLTAGQTETVAWLVENHLVMSNTAQSRDLADPRTIQTFAATIQTLDRLRMLLVLTVCDIRAVGPGVWNGWKGQLLRTLYWETEVVLAGGHSAIDRKQRVAASKHALRAALTDWSDAAFAAYETRHYPAYWIKVDLPHQRIHAELLRRIDREKQPLMIEVSTDAFRGITELTVIAPDHPRLLSIMTGACATSGVNIVDAQIFTTTDGLAVDTISISRAFERDDDELRRADRVAVTIGKALRGEIRLGDVVSARKASGKTGPTAFQVPGEVIIDNNLSQAFTVLELSGLDRPGLLYDLTNAIARLNLNIASAYIVTFGEKAVDVFYVTDLTGTKIGNAARQAAIRRQLIGILEAQTSAEPSKPRRRAEERAAPK